MVAQQLHHYRYVHWHVALSEINWPYVESLDWTWFENDSRAMFVRCHASVFLATAILCVACLGNKCIIPGKFI